LANLKTDLGITTTQENVWNEYANTLKGQVETAQAMHQTMWTQGGRGPTQERFQLHQAMWQQRQALAQATERLLGALDEKQRAIASKTFLGW
jgi:hypothetical protein